MALGSQLCELPDAEAIRRLMSKNLRKDTLALNLNSAMKHLVLEKALGKEWGTRRLKALRFHLIHLPGRLVHRSRQWFLRLTRGHPSPGALLKIRRQILQLATVPSG